MYCVVHKGRYTAAIDGDFVVFLIGMRDQPPVEAAQVAAGVRRDAAHAALARRAPRGRACSAGAAPGSRDPRSCSTGAASRTSTASPAPPASRHLQAWKHFNAAVRASGDVGIWHETYKVRAGEYEAVYGNMPRIGLAAAARARRGGHDRQTSARRIGATDADEPAVAPYENP